MTLRPTSNDRTVRRRRSRAGLPASLYVLAVGTFVTGTDGFVITGLLPDIARDLHVTAALAGQLVTAFAVTYAIASPLIGAFTAAWDRRVVLAGGLAVFLLGMAGQAAGPGFAVVALSRVVAAIGAAAFVSSAFATAGVLASDAARGRALGLVATGISVSAVVGVPIGVLAGHVVGWRFVLAAIAVAAGLVIPFLRLLPRLVLPAAGLRLRLAVLVRPAVARILLVTVLFTATAFGVVTYLAVLVHDVAPGSLVAWVLVAFGVGSIGGSQLAGRVTDRRGPAPVLAFALVGAPVTFALADVAAATLAGALVLGLAAGLVIGSNMIPQQHRLFTVAPDATVVAVGLNGALVFAGAAVGTALGGVVLANLGVGRLGPLAAIAGTGTLVLAAAFGLVGPARRPRPARTGDADAVDGRCAEREGAV